jgi:hypothetical protein
VRKPAFIFPGLGTGKDATREQKNEAMKQMQQRIAANRDEHMRIAAVWIHDEFAAFHVVKTAGSPAVVAADGQQMIDVLHNFAGLHFLCTVSAKAAKFIVRVAKSGCDSAR